jgi:lipopolysaccharide transport system ATP-binding protein
VDRPVKTYSSGMALRLAFAVATAVTPHILIVDEALAVGDEAFQRKCFARIEKIREGGAAILFVSHSPLQILELCDLALLLDAGEMLLLDEPRRVVPEYQRLLYAMPDAAARLRQRLRSASPSAEATALPAPVEQESQSIGDAAVAPEARPQPGFDPDLRSSSVVEYAPHGARIHDPRITTAAGEVVNILVRGDVYTYDYEVEFLQPARRIAFGMMIKTTSGLELGGGLYPETGDRDMEMPIGGRLRVRFDFRCQLFAGMYFLNAGVVGEVAGADVWLHRLVDAVAFRVQPDASRRQSGYVDFDIRAEAIPVPGTVR